MKIRAIRICNFRKLLGPVVIDRLGDGLTVIAGDNEEGKSTILAAVQAAFFNRHRLTGEAADAMQPFDSAVRPEIGIDFELNGEAYQLRKAFCQKPEAELIGPSGRASGDAVEEQLQALLRFEPPGRGAARAEHRGIWGLFWVEQGTAFTRPQLGQTGRETVVAALESEVGQVLGGERGRALIAAIENRSEAFFTPTGRPTGAWKEATERMKTLAGERADLAGKLSEYEGKTDNLAKLRARLRAYADDRSVEKAEAALRSAEDAQQALAARQNALAAADTAEKLAQAALRAAQTAWQARQEKIGEVDKHATREVACAQTLARKAQALAAAEGEKTRLEAVYEAAKSAFKTAEAVLDASERDVKRARVQREYDEQHAQLDKAAAAQEHLDALRAGADAIRIDDAGIADLRARQTAAEKARVLLKGSATRLQFRPDGSRRVTCNGAAIPADQPLLLTEQAAVNLEGFGTVIVTPGGDDLARQRREADDADERLAKALQRLGVADVAEAERQLSRRADLLTRAREQQVIVTAHAPEGIDALRRRLDLKAAELAELSADASRPAIAVAEAERQRDDARQKRDNARTARDGAEQELRTAEAAYAREREASLTAEAELNSARRQRQDGERALNEARGRTTDADLTADLSAKEQTFQQAAAILAQRHRELEQSSPEAVRLQLNKSEQALRQIRADIDQTTDQVRGLEGELRGLGQAGLGEQLAEKEGELERAREHAARIEREAKAIRLLLDTLREAERQAKETFLGPVRERIAPYLKLLFPGAEVILADDDLAISHLRRDGIDEPFEHLSIGTREQLAVLTRLAFAEFLRDKGRPAAVILDDALAYSDDDRFERMQLVLRRAAERLQVIILTCRERDYLALGAPITRLADCQRR